MPSCTTAWPGSWSGWVANLAILGILTLVLIAGIARVFGPAARLRRREAAVARGGAVEMGYYADRLEAHGDRLWKANKREAAAVVFEEAARIRELKSRALRVALSGWDEPMNEDEPAF